MMKIQKTIKYLVFIAVFAVMPVISHADQSDSWGGDYSGGWGDSGSGYYGSDYYAPSYDYYSDYQPYSYNDSGYSGGYGSSYPTYGYSGSSVGGSSYNPGYSYGGGSSYPTYTYSGSSIRPSGSSASATAPSNSNSSNHTTVSNNSNSNSSAVASSTNINTNLNVNNNNVYVYTNPQGTAVLQNPSFQHLEAYCSITPTNPRIGQTVTVTTYATGGIGSYTYTWGGDIYYGSGASTQFTSQTSGTKNITVTVRSGEEVVTRNCSVTFVNDYYNTYTPSYTSYTGSSVSVGQPSTGSAVSGVFIQPGTPVSGVYLNQLPATGISLDWMDYMIAFLTLVLTTVVVMISRSRKQLLASVR